VKQGLAALALAAAASTVVSGCFGGDGSGTTVSSETVGTASVVTTSGKLPPGAIEPPDMAEEQAEGPGATEASPGEAPVGPKSTGELSGEDSAAVTATVGDYIRALDRHDPRRVCSLFAPGALDLRVLPTRRGGCVTSLEGSIGTRPRGGGPAWRKTTLVEVKPEDLGDGRARVSATVTHHFSDRKYVSVEDDVIYLEKRAGRWVLAKPSGTLYRAVGYESPPLEAFRPPPGWS